MKTAFLVDYGKEGRFLQITENEETWEEPISDYGYKINLCEGFAYFVNKFTKEEIKELH